MYRADTDMANMYYVSGLAAGNANWNNYIIICIASKDAKTFSLQIMLLENNLPSGF